MRPPPTRRRSSLALAAAAALLLGAALLAWLRGPGADAGRPAASLPPPAAVPGPAAGLGLAQVALPAASGERSGVAGEFARGGAPEDGAAGPPPFHLRFQAGSTGRPAPGVAVRLLDVREEGGLVAADPSAVLASGRADEHGWFEAPASLRARTFLVVVDLGTGSESYAEPAYVAPELVPAGGRPLDVAVFGAWAVIEAHVVDPAGAPVANARVQFDLERPPFSSRDAALVDAVTDAAGSARRLLVDPASAGGRMRIRAELAGELQSQVVELAPPLASAQVELALATSAQALVRVAAANGDPLRGAMARLVRLDPPFTASGRSTDARGAAKFFPVEPGRYTASAEDPATGARASTEFTIASCQRTELSLSLPPSAQPLAVAGSVRDGAGRAVTALWISICVDGREEALLATDAAGRFAFHRAPCERLRVRVKADFDGPRVEPEVVEAEFGSRDLLFVVDDAPRFGFETLWIVDRATGEPLSGAAAAVYKDSAAESIGGVLSVLTGAPLSLATTDSGAVLVPAGPNVPRATLVVEKRGYVRREIELSELPLLPVRGERRTLELSRGYAQRWIVLDARTRAPIQGASAVLGLDPFTGSPLAGGAVSWLEARSDLRGVLELSLPEPPRGLSIHAPGYLPRPVETHAPGAAELPSLAFGSAVLLESDPNRP